MSMALCSCGVLINLDEEPEAFYIYDENDKDIELEHPMCKECKEQYYELV